MSWFLLGAQRALTQGGYTVPASSAEAVDKWWKQSADQVRGFVDAWCRRLPLDAPKTDGTGADKLYKAYRCWTTENGHKPMASGTSSASA